MRNFVKYRLWEENPTAPNLWSYLWLGLVVRCQPGSTVSRSWDQMPRRLESPCGRGRSWLDGVRRLLRESEAWRGSRKGQRIVQASVVKLGVEKMSNCLGAFQPRN